MKKKTRKNSGKIETLLENKNKIMETKFWKNKKNYGKTKRILQE